MYPVDGVGWKSPFESNSNASNTFLLICSFKFNPLSFIIPKEPVDETEPLIEPLLSTVKLLLDIVREPVILWTSDKALPNVVPPVAVRTPPIPTSSVTVKSSVTCKSENLPLRPKILPKEPVDDDEPLINGTVPSTILLADISFLVTLVEKLLESIFKASIDDVIASILAVACVILTLNDPLSTFKALIEDVIPVSYTHLRAHET